jgi:predicted  nucleic acid-binding Zn-ribbon protein
MLDEFKNTKNNIIKAKTKYAESKAKYDTEIEKIAPQCSEIRQKMIALQDSIDKNLFAKYQSIRNDKIFPVFVKLKDNHCGGCRVELPMAKVNKLKADKMITCDQCHRITVID